jgi:integrase
MAGHLRRHGGGWEGTFPNGRDPATRKKRRGFVYGKTREEAQTKLNEALAQRAKGRWRPMSRQTLGEYLEEWMGTGVRGRRAASTVYGYEQIVKQIQAAPIAAVALRDLEPGHLEAYYASKLVEPADDPAPLPRRRITDPMPRAKRARGPNTVKKHHTLLGTALRRAWKQRKIAENVAALADPPQTVPYDGPIFDTEQLRLLLGCARRERPTRIYALYAVAATGGVRQSELLGARWPDLAPDGTLMVQQALVRVPKQSLDRAFKPPKSRKGRRPVVLPDHVLDVLRGVRAEQQRDREQLGAAYHDRGLIFCAQDGRPLHAHNIVERDYKPLLRQAGLPPIPFKNLRHSHLSHLERVGTSVAVTQQRAGHSSPTITLGVYTKVMADEQREPVRRIAAELFGDRRVAPPDKSGTRHDYEWTHGGAAWERHGSGIEGILGRSREDGSHETP